MSSSPYAVTSALVVACPECKVVVGAHCTSMSTDMRDRDKLRKTVHPSRRRAADEQRTREINPKLLPPLEDEYLPMHKPLQPRMPNFCPNDHNCFPGYPCAICDGMGDV